MTESTTIADLAISAIAGYTLGALPIAYVAGRLGGVDVFQVGSRQAGATNVFREVSRTFGIAVFFADSVKGLLAVLIGRLLGLEGGWLLLPASAAVLGHWNSPFTRFKGGDGVSTITGIAVGLTPAGIVLPYLVGGLIALVGNSRLAHPSMWGAATSYTIFLIISLAPFEYVNPYLTPRLNPVIIIGLTSLGLGILVHSMVYRYRSRSWKHTAESNEGTAVQPAPLTEKD